MSLIPPETLNRFMPPELQTQITTLRDGSRVEYLQVKPKHPGVIIETPLQPDLGEHKLQPDFVLFPGGGNDLRLWYPSSAQEWSDRTGMNFYLLQNPERGGSSWPRSSSSKKLYDAASEMGRGFIEEVLGGNKVVIMGQSWGAFPASRLLEHDNVLGAILLSPLLQGYNGLAKLGGKLTAMAKSESTRESLQQFEAAPLGHSSLKESLLKIAGLAAVATAYQIWEAANPTNVVSLESRKPVLIIQGQMDPIAGPDAQPVWQNTEHTIQSVILKSGTHATFRTHRSGIAEEISSFLEQLQAQKVKA